MLVFLSTILQIFYRKINFNSIFFVFFLFFIILFQSILFTKELTFTAYFYFLFRVVNYCFYFFPFVYLNFFTKSFWLLFILLSLVRVNHFRMKLNVGCLIFFCDFGRPLFPVSILVPDANIYVVWDSFFVFKFVYLFNYDFICYFFFISIYMIFFGFCLEKFFMHIFLREVLRQMISYDFSLFSSKCHKIIIIRRHKKWVINYRIGTFWLLDF